MSELPTKPKRPRPVGNRRKTVKDLPPEYSADLSEKIKIDVVAVCKHELRKRKKEGKYDGNPDDFHPARYLANVVEDETVYHPLRLMAAKELMPYFGIDKATQAKIDAGITDGHITVHIESYAQSRPAPAIEQATPREVGAIDVVASDKELPAHRSTPVTPDVNIPRYAEYRVQNGEAIAEVVEPPSVTTDEPVVITDTAGNTFTVKRRV